MKAKFKMNSKRIIIVFLVLFFCGPVFSQPTQPVTDNERKFKEAKDLFVQEQYALAYPLLSSLRETYPASTASDHAYLNEDIDYFFIACQLKLKLPVAETDARHYIHVVANEPRRQLLSYHLARYYFSKEDFSSAIDYYERAGIENLSNEQVADAKFEKAYSYFSLKQYQLAKPLFSEIAQLDDSKYFYPANYYYGYLCFSDREYAEALRALKLAATQEEYKEVVPYYIAEIYYFQGKKDEALRYGETVLARGEDLLNRKQLNLLVGQLHFEKKNYAKALPRLEEYVNGSEKVNKEVLYELSYCYYEAEQLNKAIEGFKQLSNETDSMGQNSMYLLGDCYLRTNQKANARNAFQFCAYNNSNKKQQQVSRFTYAKLSYELGFQDIALSEMKKYLSDYPGSEYDTEAKEILVSLLANTSNFADALQLYESFSKPTPAMQAIYPRILYGRAVELINDQQLSRADELLNKLLLLPASPVTPYGTFWKGEIAYRQKEYDAAIRYLTAFLQANMPALGEATPMAAKYNLGYSWLQKEHYAKALGFFEQITRSVTPTSSAMDQDAYVRSADCYFMNRDFARAGNMYDNVLNNALPQSDYALFQKAMIAGIKSADEKIRILNSLVRQYPKSSMVPDVTMEIANTYMAEEKFNEAIPFLNNILGLSDGGGLKASAYLKLGLCYYNTNRNAEALKYYQSLIKLFPQSAEADEALENMKNIYVEEGRPNDYVELMRQNGKNISVSEADSLTYISAELKYAANDCTAAIAGFGNYINRFPDGARLLEAHFFMAECYNKAKDYPNALSGYDYVNARGLNRYFERATMEAARICYFEQKDYANAKKYFQSLLSGSVSQDNQLEALRGLVRCFYQLKDYAQANEAARTLLTKKGISTDDRSVAFLVLGKSQQVNNNCTEAIAAFRSCAAINKTAWGAEARYEMARCQFELNNLSAAEKTALSVIKETGSYDNWVTKSYILLGDIFMQQKDYFNAKATYESVARNAVIPELKTEAQQKLDRAIEEEKATSKVN
ncbi:MAG: tetratricopeptide repeat protein [Chitinophagaceae bacterium]|nr:tetratricopeptide repeat protein [Chitinophagaceae bacterium]